MQFNPTWSYLPLRRDSKAPANSNGVHGAARPGSMNFSKMLASYPADKFDWGIACGPASNLTVIDIDVKGGGLDTLKSLEEKHNVDILNYTYTVKTPSGGYHLYFQYNPQVKNTVKFLPGWDTRSENGYVKRYDEVVNNDYIEPLPDLLLDLIQSNTKKTKQALVASQGEVIEGGRNHYLTQVAGKLQRSNLLTYEALAAINDRDCLPPIDDEELTIIYNSVSRYAPDELPNVTKSTTNLLQTSTKSLEDVYRALTGKSEGGAGDGQVVKASDLSSAAVSYLNDKEKVKGEATLIEGLDKLLGGGHRLGEVTCWHAHAKTGKNTLWHKLMHLWLTRTDKKPIPIAYASRELTPESEVIPDLLSIHLQRNVRLLNAKEGEYESILSSWPLYFASGYGHFSFDSIIKWVLECKSLGVQHFWFDHLHYMLEDPEDHKEASKLIKNIKSLAKLENINVQIIIQPNKLMDGQRLSLNSIKGGAAMGQAIDNLITLERVRCETPNIMRLRTDAVRSKLARIGEIYLQYNPQTIDMVEVEEDVVKLEEAPTYGKQQF